MGRRKWALSALATLAMMVATTACAASGPEGSGTPSNSGDTAGKTTITWLSARNENDASIKAIRQILAAYQVDHPNFDIDIQFSPDRPSYLQRVKILATSGELPEWFDADPEPYFADLVANGTVTDIEALYKELGVQDSFLPIATEYPRLPNGSLNLITWYSNAEYFFYNKDVFSKAGIEPPTTLDGLLETCDAIKATGVAGMSIAGKNRWPYYRFLAMPAFRAEGNDFLLNLAQGKASMLDPVGLQSSTFLQQLGQRCFPEGHTTTDATTAPNLMVSGEAGMYYIGTWDLTKFLGDDGELLPNIGMFTMPPLGDHDATAPTDYFINPSIGTAIRADALNDEMKGFLAYLFKEYPNTLLYDFKTLPSMKPEIRDELPQLYAKILDDIAGVKVYARVWDVVLDPNTVDTLSREAENLTLGLTTPNDFGTAIDDAVASYLSKK